MADQLSEKAEFERLPSDVVPVNYKLELQPDLNSFTFRGKLEITAKVGGVGRRVCKNARLTKQ